MNRSHKNNCFYGTYFTINFLMMKTIKYFLLLCLLLCGTAAFSKKNTIDYSDTTLSFKVFGVCEQCKERIEKATKIKGVSNANWDVDTKMLTIQFDPSKISLNKIENRIVDVGHDIENKKAKDYIYKSLDACCLYRDINKTENVSHPENGQKELANNEVIQNKGITLNTSLQEEASGVHYVKGLVVAEDNKGKFTPLLSANIRWVGGNLGVVTDSMGFFIIPKQIANKKLIISYTGYQSDTLLAGDWNEVKVVLAANRQLKEVTVMNRQRASYIATISPFRMEVMTGRELLKAACCNLSESFETNPSVDVSYNDAVTGSKQIQLLGLSGNYTQLTVENLPGPRGIATPLGLNSIAGPWIESIQLTKGVGSVANGFESIAGQINVELKKPENSEKVLANVYINDFGKTDVNLNLSTNTKKKWSAALLLHDDFLTNTQLDFNKDGFRDLPTGNQLSLVNRYKFDNGKGLLAQFGIKYLHDQRTGGETDFDPDKYKYSNQHYGLGISIERVELFAKIGYVFPQQKYKSIGWQLAAINHQQNSYFGQTDYNAKQQSFYSNLIYQSIIHTTEHKFRTGLSFQADKYDEDFSTKNYKRSEIVPGTFFEYTFTPTDKFSAVAGIRADYNNLYGFFATPRLNIRYEPIKGTVIRASAGRGQRTANIFAENTSVFVSARQINILSADQSKAYGLNPEVAWNKGISVDQKFRIFNNDAMLSLDYFRNDFTDQVIVDLENVREVKFYNLQGKSYSNSFQAEINVTPFEKFDMRLAYRYFDVKATYAGQLLQRPLIAGNRAFASMDYVTNDWKFNYTLTYNGKKRIPNTNGNPPAYQLTSQSPDFVLMNAQITKTFGNKYPMDFYVGAENLTNFFQKDPIIAADQPFSQYFDASLVWGPVSGRMFYIGWRLKIK